MPFFPLIHNSATIASSFGVSAALFAVFFFGEVPRVRKDILMKIPILGDYFDRTVPPEDNVSRCSIPQTVAGNLMIWRSSQFHHII
jgi:hypothetical protein